MNRRAVPPGRLLIKADCDGEGGGRFDIMHDCSRGVIGAPVVANKALQTNDCFFSFQYVPVLGPKVL